MLACVAGLSVLFMRSASAADGDSADGQLAATIYLGSSEKEENAEDGIYRYNDFTEGWGSAVDKASAAYSSNKYVKVILESNWTAKSRSFGTDAKYFSNGAILSPANTKIVMDLNGKTVSRGINGYLENGQVISVSGNLTVDDSAEGGKITGGGGIAVNGGVLNLKGGSIEKNEAYYGGGVYVSDGTFNMYGGSIAENNSTFGGGVCVYTSGLFNMYGGVIDGNKAVYGGGVACYNVTGTAINIENGIIKKNVAVNDRDNNYGGGGICVFMKGDVTVSGGEIRHNRTDRFGGGICVLAYERTTTTITVSGGKIHHNVAAAIDKSAAGGGIAVLKTGTSDDVIVNAKLSGGSIENNAVVSNCESAEVEPSYQAMGGGVYVSGATLVLNGEEAEIKNNGAYSVVKGTDSETLDQVSDGLMYDAKDIIAEYIRDGIKTLGGGVYVNGSLVIEDGSIYGNKANEGGGLYALGSLEMSGGSINDNCGVLGGGLYFGADAEISLSGKPEIAGNYSTLGEDKKVATNLKVGSANAKKIKIVGKLDAEANIYISVADSLVSSGVAITDGYGANNGKDIYSSGREARVYANPCNYFVSDADGSKQYIVVLETGEISVLNKAVEFNINYSSGKPDKFIYGDAGVAEENKADWTYVERAYSASRHPESFAVTGGVGTGIGNVGLYTQLVNLGSGNTDIYVRFTVVVTPGQLNNDNVSIELSDDNLISNGKNPQKPSSCTVKVGNFTLVEGVDYELSYENCIEAGTDATVIVTFKGNYTGEARATYTIYSYDSPEMTAVITWEILKDGEWVIYDKEADKLTYNGGDLSENIRAKLTVRADVQYVYAYGVEDSNIYLVFNGNKDNKLENAGSYTVKIEGNGKYKVLDADRSLAGLTVKPMELELSREDFVEYKEAGDQRLWLLQIGTGDNAVYTNLLDSGYIYIDPNAKENEFGEKVSVTDKPDSYARYRGEILSIILNGEYVLADGTTVANLKDIATITYAPAGRRGESGKVNEITTTVTITFNGNYALKGGNVIEFTKTWYIVTIANNLRLSSGEEVPGLDSVEWSFADVSEVKSYEFRPEHGNTVIYTYYSDADELLGQFALVYSNDTSAAEKNYYAVKTVDGKLVADTGKLLVGANGMDYLRNYNFTLAAGKYKIRVTVPRVDPHTGSHIHWWADDTSADDYGTIYYEINFEYSVTVNKYLLAKEGVPGAGLEIVFPEMNWVRYNGSDNNFVRPVIRLNGLELKEGTHYTLSSSSVDVGRAELTVHGIGSLEGEYTKTNAYYIVMADNGWQEVPYIMYWTYSGYLKNVNRIMAKPIFLSNLSDMWFAISHDSEGTDLVKGLEHVVLDSDGLVSDEIAALLTALPAASYYLIGQVDGTNNYRPLEHQIIPFTVFVANNSWEDTPRVNSWIQGKYNEVELDENGNEIQRIVANSMFGDPHIKIVDDDGKVYYDSDNALDLLADAKAGRYTLTAWVDETDNYYKLDVYTFVFQIFERPGLPWWAVLLIVVGALGLAALVIFILWKQGVFRIVTDKILVSIRTRVSVEATIASVRAAKMMEEGRKSVEAAKKRDEEERLRKEAEAKQANEAGESKEAPSENKTPENGDKPESGDKNDKN